jgi:hypothetical protein
LLDLITFVYHNERFKKHKIPAWFCVK